MKWFFKIEILLVFLALVILEGTLWAQQQQNIPAGYKLVYSEDFSDASPINEFIMTDKSAWKVEDGVLELFGKSNYEASVRSPFNIALIKGLLLGDFILEVNLAQTGREYGHRDLCVFFNVKDPTNFYYVHLATKADDHANNIFLVNDEPRVKIAEKTSTGTNWGDTGSWHKVRIERKVDTGSIRIFFDDMEEPVMVATDTHFDYGHIGFGSFDDTGRFDNIKIWAPNLVQKKQDFFH